MLNDTKYKEMILTAIKCGANTDGKITKIKLAKLVYLADFIWYYLHLESMSGAEYRKLPYGPVSDAYFRMLSELEDDEIITVEKTNRAKLISCNQVAETSALTSEQIILLTKICKAWQSSTTQEIVDFTHKQLPWQICRDREIIPYCLIIQEEPEQIYGKVQL
ncbi:MAG: Panacea domain-containing protein [Defluviitaleaceae bacterium]|nr:Panacea domain-containing protein [Defluviitaleaceae bacterium]